MDIQELQKEIEHLKQEILNFKYNSTQINKHTKVLFDENKCVSNQTPTFMLS